MKKFFVTYRKPLLILLVFCFLFILHVSFLPNGFTWLDHGDIEEGRAILPIEHLTDAFFMRFGETGFYRPLVTLLHSLDFAGYGFFAPGFHLTNVFLHSLVATMAPFFLSCFLVLSFPETLLVMVLVGVHPLGALPVGQISYRSELLVTLFTFLAVFLHVQARLKGSQILGFFTLVAIYLALLSKETALVIIPLVILFWEFINRKKVHHPIWTQLLSEGFIFGIYLLFRFRAVPEYWRMDAPALSFFDAIGTRLHVFLAIVVDFLTPWHIRISDVVKVTSFFSWEALFVLIALLALVYFVLHTRLRSQLARLILLFLILCLPIFSIIPVPRLGSPHYGYLPLVSFVGFVILFVRFGYKKPKMFKRIFTVFIAVWIGSMLATNYTDGSHYRNDKTLFLPEVQVDSHFLEGYFYLGNWYLSQSDLHQAEAAYKNALKTDSHYVAYNERRAILVNLASVYLARNDLVNADKTLTQAEYVDDSQNVAGLMHNRMLYLYKKHDYKGVFELSQDGRSFPYATSTYFILADSLHQLGRDNEAISLLQGVLPHTSGNLRREIEKQLQVLKKK